MAYNTNGLPYTLTLLEHYSLPFSTIPTYALQHSAIHTNVSVYPSNMVTCTGENLSLFAHRRSFSIVHLDGRLVSISDFTTS